MIPFSKRLNRVIIKDYRGRNAYGEDVYSDPYERVGIVNSERKLVRDSQGQEVVSNTSVHIDPTDVPEGSEVTVWPGETNKVSSKVIAVQQWRTGRNSHTVLDLK